MRKQVFQEAGILPRLPSCCVAGLGQNLTTSQVLPNRTEVCPLSKWKQCSKLKAALRSQKWGLLLWTRWTLRGALNVGVLSAVLWALPSAVSTLYYFLCWVNACLFSQKVAFSTREGLFYSSANQLCGIDFVHSEHSNAPFVKQMTAQNTQRSRDGRDAL